MMSQWRSTHAAKVSEAVESITQGNTAGRPAFSNVVVSRREVRGRTRFRDPLALR